MAAMFLCSFECVWDWAFFYIVPLTIIITWMGSQVLILLCVYVSMLLLFSIDLAFISSYLVCVHLTMARKDTTLRTILALVLTYLPWGDNNPK